MSEILIDIGLDLSSAEASIKQFNSQIANMAKSNATKGLAQGFDSAVASSQKFIDTQKKALVALELVGQKGSPQYKEISQSIIDATEQTEKFEKATKDVEERLSKQQSGGFFGGLKNGISEGLSGLTSLVNPATLTAGAIAGVGVAISKLTDSALEYDDVQDNLELSFKQAGLSGDALTKQLEETNHTAVTLGNSLAVAPNELRKLSAQAGALGGATGKANADLTKLAIGIEKATNGAVSGEQAIKVFSRGIADPENADAIDKLTKKFPQLAGALTSGASTSDKLANSLKALAPTFQTLEEQAGGADAVVEKFTNNVTEGLQQFAGGVLGALDFQSIIDGLGEGLDLNVIFDSLNSIGAVVGQVITETVSLIVDLGKTIYEALKPVFEVFGTLIDAVKEVFNAFSDGGKSTLTFTDVIKGLFQYIKFVIDFGLIPLRIAIKVVSEYVKSVINVYKSIALTFADWYKNSDLVRAIINGVVSAVQSLSKFLSPLIDKIRDFLGLGKKKVEIKADTTQANKELDNLDTKFDIKHKEKKAKVSIDKDSVKTALDDFSKFTQDVLSKNATELTKSLQDARIKDIEEQKQAVLENTTISETERANLILKLDSQLANQRLTNQLQSLDKQEQQEIDSINTRYNALKGLNSNQQAKALEERNSALKSIDDKYNEQRIALYENTANEIQKIEKTSAKELEKINKEQLKKDQEAQKQYNELYLASIKDVNEREKQTALFNLQDKLDTDLEKFKDNEAIKTALIEKFQIDRAEIEKKYEKTSLFGNLASDFTKNIKGIDWSKFFNTKDLQEKRKTVDSEFKKQQDDLKSQYDKGTLSYEEYQNSLTDLDKKRTDDLKAIAEEQKSIFDGLNEALSQSFQSQVDSQNKAIESNIEKLKGLQEGTQEFADTMSSTYESLGAVVGLTFAKMAVDGQSLTKSLVLSTLAGVKAIVPILAVEILGKEFATKGIFGIATSGVLTGLLYGALAVAESAISNLNFKDGVIDLQGAGTETSDSIKANLSKGESVITARATRLNKPLLEFMNRGGDAMALMNRNNDNGLVVNELKALRSEVRSTKLSETHMHLRITDNNNKEIRTKKVGLYR